MTEEPEVRPVAVITGASSGIGLAAAMLFNTKGYSVYGLNRRIPSEKHGVSYICTDVTQPDSVRNAIESIWQKEHRIDILINNAGYGISGAVEFTGCDDAVKQFEVNFYGMFICIQAVLPHMREQKHGKIINMSSVAGVIPIPFQAFYSASKAAVNSLTLALANEVRPYGIHVCAIMPGDVRTGFTSAREKTAEGREIYPALTDSVASMEKDEQNGMSPEYIAKVIFRIAAKRKPKPLCVAGVSYKFLVLLNKLLPVRLANRIVGWIYAK